MNNILLELKNCNYNVYNIKIDIGILSNFNIINKNISNELFDKYELAIKKF
jgi:hypothetical protein